MIKEVLNKKKIEGKYIVYILGLYFIAVIIYLVFANFFSIPVHMRVDEELYISMAKSFHYNGNFSKEGVILDYTCVLYSVLLSFAYYFYDPERIMYIFRSIGVCVMLSSVFPTFFLGYKVLQNGKKALYVSAFLCILPSMMDVVFCMQEVLSYPLFLWLLYFIYEEVRKDKIGNTTLNTFLIVLFSVLCYFTKTYMIFIPLVYCMLLLVYGIKNRTIALWKKIFIFLITYLSMIFMGNKIIFFINDGIVGSNHYSSQFSNLFPITWNTILSFLTCSILYIAGVAFCWGILPIFLPIANWKKHSTKDKYFLFFILISFSVLVIEIILSIVLTEEGNVLFPHKILYRYFQILEVPIIILFVKYFDKYIIKKVIWSVYFFVFTTLIIYYTYIGKNQRTAIIDAPLLLLMENINRYIIPYFNLLVCFVSVLFIILIYLLKKKKIINDVLKSFTGTVVVFCVLFFLVNLIQLPLYTNVIANGKMIEEDAVKLASFLRDYHDKKYKIYFLDSSDLFYERSVSAYLDREVIFITKDNLGLIEKEDMILICDDDSPIMVDNYEEIDIGTDSINIYVNREG